MRYVLLGVAWAAYGTLHSAMISEGATGYLKRRLGEGFRFYRLFFNAVAVVTLIPVLWYESTLRQEAVWRWEGAWVWARYGLVACGVWLAVAGGGGTTVWGSFWG